MESAIRTIEQDNNRPAKEEEIAAALNITVANFQTLITELHGLTVTGLDRGDDDDESGMRPHQIPDDPQRTPLAFFERAEVRALLSTAVEHLPERERQVVSLYYLEELTMKEVGAVLGVTESRVSQIHTQAGAAPTLFIVNDVSKRRPRILISFPKRNFLMNPQVLMTAAISVTSVFVMASIVLFILIFKAKSEARRTPGRRAPDGERDRAVES
ncbi:MAG: sigma-70 family RNA polymerase sigma factor [Pyrinomonadaceae bacterium]